MHKQKGFGAVEYVLGLALLGLALLTPVMEGKNAAQLLVEGVKSHHAGYIYAQSRSHLQLDAGDLE